MFANHLRADHCGTWLIAKLFNSFVKSCGLAVVDFKNYEVANLRLQTKLLNVQLRTCGCGLRKLKFGCGFADCGLIKKNLRCPALLITICHKPTNSRNLYLLAVLIAPLKIRKKAASKQERSRQVCDARHMLFNYKTALSKSIESFLHNVDSLEGKITTWVEKAWERNLK